MSRRDIITAEQEPDDFLRYLQNLGSRVVFSCHITEQGGQFVWAGKWPANETALLRILKEFQINIEERLK
ncbi:hypothetical protein FAI40_01805 [Acetobacteraceae bacterium]|nr:hypothetical protein FAI40_01805 [Acetobacteraceae bacterium]